MPRCTSRNGGRRFRIAVAALAAAASVGLSACSSSTDDAGGEGGGGAAGGTSTAVGDMSKWPKTVADSGLVKGLTLPLQPYMQTYQDSMTIERAARTLETECMAGYGFTVVFPPVGVNPPPNADDANMPRRYGLSDRAAAATYGYQLPPDATEHPAPPQLSPAAVAVLTGRKGNNPRAEAAPSTYKGRKVPEGGCQAQAFDKLGARIDFTLPSRLDHESLVRSQEDPRVRSSLGAWSACMKGKGYTVADPFAAADIAAEKATGDPTQEEITLALADIDCKKETDLVAVWHRVDAEIQARQVEENQLALQQLKDRNSKAVKAAEAALRG
ncbi:hypothetical protein AB0E77_05755 [Streptomyces sp. NPDC032940]|uniref:hypothetical protein n=1 Tax=Streptomyces sp. NPDC032940 TaxID=3155366 RepID=UPI003407FB8C